MSHNPLADIVLDGVDRTLLRFGYDGAAVFGGACVARGKQYFSRDASSPTIAVLLTNDQPTVEVLLGAIATGARVVSLPLPPRGGNPDDYLSFIRQACRVHEASEVVARDDVSGLLEAAGVTVRPHSQLGGRPLAERGSGFELVQYTSGSTNRPKAVRLTSGQLAANVNAIIEVIEPRPGDKPVSWLPLSHDMGLIGMLLTSLASTRESLARGGEVVLLDPAEFLRDPTAWLRAISECGGTITAAPDFGYRLCINRQARTTLDLSSLRCAIVGGEIVRPSTLARFSDRFRPAGFRPTAFCPAYGLAELGVAATLTPLDEDWRELEVSDDVPTTLVSSGRVCPGYELRCDDGEGSYGPIAIRGPSIGTNALTGVPFADPDGWMRTADVGMVRDGWVYVYGRDDDVVVAHGRNVFAPAIEDALGDVEGIRAGRVAAIGVASGDWVIAVEPAARTLDGRELGAVLRRIRQVAFETAGCSPNDVVVVERGCLPFTSSGKLQRHELRRRYLARELNVIGETTAR